MMAPRRGLGFKEGTTSKAAPTHMVHNETEGTQVVREILKLPRTPRPEKDKQAIGPVRMSPRNPQLGRLSMEEKGKIFTIETNEEEDELQALITKVKEEEDVEVDTQPMHSIAKLPKYVPP